MTLLRHLLFSLLLLLAPLAQAGVTVAGTIGRIGPQVTLRIETRVLRVSTQSRDVQKILNRLEEGDSIVATGDTKTDLGLIDIQSIDFVGLRKMLGVWNSTNARGILEFKTYSEMKVYSVGAPVAGPAAGLPRTRSFKYTLSPTGNDDWVLFMSDDSATKMGFLRLQQNDATISMLDSSTGDISQVLRLQKVGP